MNYKQKYYLEHKEEILQYKRNYYKKNKDKIIDYHKKYREENHDKLVEGKKKYYLENREKILESRRTPEIRKKMCEQKKKYYWENREKILERCKISSRKRADKIREYTRTHKYEQKNRAYVTKYNLTLQKYQEMNLSQKGKCLICGLEKFLVVDHCHKSNKVRGLLCDSCNRGLGFFHDSIENLKSAIKYLSVIEETK